MTEFTKERPEFLYEVQGGEVVEIRILKWHSDKSVTYSEFFPPTECYRQATLSDVWDWDYRKTVDEAIHLAYDNMKVALLEAVQELEDMQHSVDAMALAMPDNLESYRSTFEICHVEPTVG